MEVVCVRQGNKYGKEYVSVLRRMVKNHLDKDLICLGDDFPIRSYEGFWSKMELFAPWNDFLRPCLFFDLDTYILDDCRDLLIDTEDLWLIKDFYNPSRSNSGVMILPKDTSKVWENHFKWESRADGDFLTTQPHQKLQDKFKGIVSYKVSCLYRPMGRIVCFHGHPKPHTSNGWAKDLWQKHLTLTRY